MRSWQTLFAARVAGRAEDGPQPAFGNGLDDNGNGVVDEPPSHPTLPNGAANAAPAKQARRSPCTLRRHGPRRLRARSVTIRAGPSPPTRCGRVSFTPATSTYWPCCWSIDPALRRRLPTRRRRGRQSEFNRSAFLAQWAINVVDFYDRDSIMTPFKYDRSRSLRQDGRTTIPASPPTIATAAPTVASSGVASGRNS